MALVTVQRSPSPSIDPDEVDTGDNGEDFTDSRHHMKKRSKKAKQKLKQIFSSVHFISKLRPRLSQSYFTVKGAALILPHTEFTRKSAKKSHGGEIQHHLQAMLHLLRPKDTIRIAIKLEDVNQYQRYLALVSTTELEDSEESVLLGIDCTDTAALVGLVLTVWMGQKIKLGGDGGFSICVEEQRYLFKPVSVQAMWTAIQSLAKVQHVADEMKYIPDGLTHSWVGYYRSMIDWADAARISQWTVEGVEIFVPSSLSLKPSNGGDERMKLNISLALKEVMSTVDLDEATSVMLRKAVEEKLGISLAEYKSYFDEEMIRILGQMDEPSQILDYLYLGSEWNASNLDELLEKRIDFILNVTREIDNFFEGRFHYCNVRVNDDDQADLLKHWERTFKFITKARDRNSKVLVHCKMGVSRSASTVMAFIMKDRRLSVEEAFQFVKERRSCVHPNESFMKQLHMYEGILTASNQRDKFRSKSDQNLLDDSTKDEPDNLTYPFLGDSLFLTTSHSDLPMASGGVAPEEEGTQIITSGHSLDRASKEDSSSEMVTGSTSSSELSSDSSLVGFSPGSREFLHVDQFLDVSLQPSALARTSDEPGRPNESESHLFDPGSAHLKATATSLNDVAPLADISLQPAICAQESSLHFSATPLVFQPHKSASEDPMIEDNQEKIFLDTEDEPNNCLKSHLEPTRVLSNFSSCQSDSFLDHALVDSALNTSANQCPSLDSSHADHSVGGNSHTQGLLSALDLSENSLLSSCFSEFPQHSSIRVETESGDMSPTEPIVVATERQSAHLSTSQQFLKDGISFTPGKVQKLQGNIKACSLSLSKDVAMEFNYKRRTTSLSEQTDGSNTTGPGQSSAGGDKKVLVHSQSSGDLVSQGLVSSQAASFEREEIPVTPGTVRRTRQEYEDRQRLLSGDGDQSAPSSPHPVLRSSSLRQLPDTPRFKYGLGQRLSGPAELQPCQRQQPQESVSEGKPPADMVTELQLTEDLMEVDSCDCKDKDLSGGDSSGVFMEKDSNTMIQESASIHRKTLAPSHDIGGKAATEFDCSQIASSPSSEIRPGGELSDTALSEPQGEDNSNDLTDPRSSQPGSHHPVKGHINSQILALIREIGSALQACPSSQPDQLRQEIQGSNRVKSFVRQIEQQAAAPPLLSSPVSAQDQRLSLIGQTGQGMSNNLADENVLDKIHDSSSNCDPSQNTFSMDESDILTTLKSASSGSISDIKEDLQITKLTEFSFQENLSGRNLSCTTGSLENNGSLVDLSNEISASICSIKEVEDSNLPSISLEREHCPADVFIAPTNSKELTGSLVPQALSSPISSSTDQQLSALVDEAPLVQNVIVLDSVISETDVDKDLIPGVATLGSNIVLSTSPDVVPEADLVRSCDVEHSQNAEMSSAELEIQHSVSQSEC